MNINFLTEKEERHGVKLTATPNGDGCLILSFLNTDGSESSLRVTNRDANAFRKIQGLTDSSIRYTGNSFKLYLPN